MAGSIRCHRPWQEMIIDSDGTVNPCCYWGAYGNVNEPMGNANRQSVEEIWNGEGYRRLRREMARGDLEAAGCANCYALKQDLDLQLLFDPDGRDDDSPYARNIRSLEAEVAAGAEVLASKPTLVAIAPSHHCHLRCLHCSQEPSRTAQLSRPEALDEVLALAPVLVRLNAVGGEPFILPAWRNFLKNFDPASNPYLCFSTCTSASLVADEIFEQMDRFKTVNVNVSLDGTRDVYEAVRVNARWQTVIDNLERFRGLVEAKPGSGIGISMSVMRSNIRDLPNLIRFAAERRLLFSATPVTTPLTESLASFASGPGELEGWRQALDEARTVIEQVWLPSQYAEATERERAAWLGAIDHLLEAIPFHLFDRPHFRVRMAVPASERFTLEDGNSLSLAEFASGRGAFLHFYPAGETWRVAPYHAPLRIENGKARFDAALPAGRFEAFLGDKWGLQTRDWITVSVPEGVVAGSPVEGQWDRGRWSLLWRGAEKLAALRRRWQRKEEAAA